MSGPERVLCRLDDLPDGEARGFPAPPGGLVGLFAVRAGAQVRVFLNACPHLGVALDVLPGHFLDAPAGPIACGVHGALFSVEDGECFAGPCVGDALEAVPVRLRDGVDGIEIVVPSTAGL